MRVSSAGRRAASASGVGEFRTGRIGELHPIRPVHEGWRQDAS